MRSEEEVIERLEEVRNNIREEIKKLEKFEGVLSEVEEIMANEGTKEAVRELENNDFLNELRKEEKERGNITTRIFEPLKNL